MFMVEAHVIFDTPRYYSSDGKTHIDEYRYFGAAGGITYIKEYLDNYIDKYGSSIDWESSSIDPIEIENIPEKIIGKSVPLTGEGVWYFSQIIYSSPNKVVNKDTPDNA